jgi:hypothetical protein
MMKAFIRTAIAMTSLAATPVFAQVQLFEQDLSGVVPYAGLKWNQAVTEAMLGVEYTIEGRATLGASYAMPLKDTISWDSSAAFVTDKPTAYVVNPYAIFEFIEPGNLSNFSFAIRADVVYESIDKADDNYNSFRRLQMGAGPMFAWRTWTSDRFAIIPTVSYQFYYVDWKKDELTSSESGYYRKGDGVANDFTFSCPFYYKLNEYHGISFEPKALVKFGEGRTDKDLVNIHAQVAYVWTN